MRVLVSDASILADLKRGSLLESSFHLPFQFAVPDVLYDRELDGHGGDELIRLGLAVEELDGDGITRALAYRQRIPALSLPDSFALALAQNGEWVLLSGDSALHELGDNENVECHGVLWLLDEIHGAAVATIQELHDGLTAISRHPRCCLPVGEVRRRLRLYARDLP